MLRTAVVTGGCSGMGLSLTRHLLATRKWRVVLADVSSKKYDSIANTLDESTHCFVSCDVSEWKQQHAMFQTAFEWNGENRIDFVAMNAGIDDMALGPRWPFATSDGEPLEPSLKVLGVDLNAIIYGTHLMVHFAKLTRDIRSNDLAGPGFHPTAIVTASMAAQYPFYNIPQYTAAKHGCLGWTRAVAPSLWEQKRIAINCILPGTVDTGLIPQEILAQWPKSSLTPMATILNAFDQLLYSGAMSGDEMSQQRFGCAVEAAGKNLYYRDPVAFANSDQEWIANQSKADGIIGRATTAYFSKSI